MVKENIVLIGFMGVGKGRTARCLASQAGMFAVDCDDLIESFANRKIKSIFADQGESYFRKLEQKTAKWLENSVQSTVISTGGGFFKVKNLRKLGIIVYLHADFEEILAGMTSDVNAAKKLRKRPLLQDMDKARALYNERVPLYRKIADLEISVSGSSPEKTAAKIVSFISAEKRKKKK